MSTTANKILGLGTTGMVIINEYATMIDEPGKPFRHGTLDDFVIRREGYKRYAFYEMPKHAVKWFDDHRAVARYKCSHLEAKRRFTLFLIKKRLMS